VVIKFKCVPRIINNNLINIDLINKRYRLIN